MKPCAAAVVPLVLLFAGCGRAPLPAADPDLAAEIQRIRAIDNHAHPVCAVAAGEQPDRGFDALPVDNMEPESDPVNQRPGSANAAEAARALWGGLRDGKQRRMRETGGQYPAWVLDRMGVEVMLANRVEMGPGIQPPRFRWVPYADALMYPLDNSRLAAQNPDRGAFFPLEDKLLRRYLEAAGLKTPPATLAEYLARVVTPTLERQKQGGAVAEKFEAAYLRSLAFDKVDRAAADRIYAQFAGKAGPAQDLLLPPATLAASLREWLEWVPEKVMFGTDAYPYLPEIGWEETGWIAARTGRQALAIALTGMMRDGEISRARASELARMVLRDNARALYGL